MRVAVLLAATAVIGVAACRENKPAQTDTARATPPAAAALPAGEQMLPVPDGRIWYKKSGTGTGTPVILVHGGPGFSSYYLKSLEALGSDRPVIRYDQLGGGKSDTIADTSLFTIAHFVRELDSLRAALGYDKVHILGHSWGTILAYEYYRAHPEHVASITFGSAVFDVPAYEKRARSLVATLSDSAQKAIKGAEAAKKYDAPSYQNAINEFYGKYVFRHPVEADLDSTFKTVNEGIYNYMQGPSEFTITGTLKKYNVRSGLPAIKVPTLYTVGEFDEVGADLVRGFAAATPGAKFELIPGSAHITSWDNPEAMLRVVREFLLKADTAKVSK
jgi:proline iminopeptidase